jgi:hypothetical protein
MSTKANLPAKRLQPDGKRVKVLDDDDEKDNHPPAQKF